MSRHIIPCIVAGAAALAVAGPALALDVTPSATAVPRGDEILILGTGFRPVGGGCQAVQLTVGGKGATLTGRLTDAVGGVALRMRATQRAGTYTVALTQRCTTGGRTTTLRGTSRLRVLA